MFKYEFGHTLLDSYLENVVPANELAATKKKFGERLKMWIHHVREWSKKLPEMYY